MLLVGKRRRPDLSFVAADALQLPYADASFDAVTISFGLRNVEDTAAALNEMRRVTKPGRHARRLRVLHAHLAAVPHPLLQLSRRRPATNRIAGFLQPGSV